MGHIWGDAFLPSDQKAEDPLRKVAAASTIRRLCNILKHLEVVGNGHIDKPTDADGKNWKLVLDGAETTAPDSFPKKETALDPRTHEIQNVDLIEDDPDTGAIDRHTLTGFGVVPSPEPDPDPDTWRVCLWKPATLLKDAVLQWPLLVTAIGDAIITYITTLTTGAAWPSGTVPPDHAHGDPCHTSFGGDQHISAGSTATQMTQLSAGYMLLGGGIDAGVMPQPADMYARNRIDTSPYGGPEDNYLGHNMHVEGRLHTGTADAVPTDGGATSGAGDVVLPVGACIWMGNVRYQPITIMVANPDTGESYQVEVLGRVL
jgi:hypothetical protein